MSAQAITGAAEDRRRQEQSDRQHGAKGAGTNFLTLAGQTSLIFFQLLGTRLFGAAVWGAYAFGLSVVEVCARLGLAGSDKGILIFVSARRATGDSDGADRAVATGIRLSLVLGLGLAALVAAVSGPVGTIYNEPTYTTSLRYLAAAIPMVTLTTVLLACTMALKTLRYNLLVKGLTEPALRIALVAAVGLTASGIGPLATVFVLAAAGTLAVAAWCFLRMPPLRKALRRVADAPLDRSMVRYALPLAAAEFANSFLAQTNILVLGMFRSTDEVGVYAACVLLGGAVSFIRGMFDTVLAPVAAEAWAQGDRLRLASNLKMYCRMVLLFATPLCTLFVVGGSALLALHGPEFVSGSRALAILALGHLVNASFGLAGWVVLASGHSRIALFNNIAVFVLNIVLCLVLVPRMGMEGAALAAVASILALNAAQSIEAWIIARAHPLSRGFVRLLVLSAAVIGGELAALHMLGSDSVVLGIVVAVLGAPAFAAAAWLSAAPDERALVRGMLRRKSRPAAGEAT